MSVNTEKNSFSSNSIWEEVPDKKARKELFILILEGKLDANDEKYLLQWKSLLYVLIKLNTKEDLMEYFLMPSFAECFFDKTLTNAVKSILACCILVNKEFNQVLDSILVQTLLIWSKNLRDCPLSLWKIVYDNILVQNNPFYKIKKSMLDLESPLETSSEHLAWLQTLKKGDVIDCVKTNEEYQILKVWSHAEIVSMNERSIKVSFINNSEKSQEIYKTASCHEIAPYKTKCDDFEWRMSLQPGDLIDACDRWKRWNNAIIIETRENMQGEKEVLVGFRTYTEDGDQVDSKGRKCFGSLENYDEWVNATSLNIAKKNSMSMISTFDPDGDRLNDSIDRIFKPSSSEKTVYAIYQEGRCKSITFVNIINQFGKHGGFENISRTLLDKTNPISTENGQRFCKNLSKLNETLHRTFVLEYASKLQDFWAPEIKGVWRDKYIDILDGFLRRIYSKKTIWKIVESYKSPKALENMKTDELIEYLEKNGLPQEYLENSEKRNKLFSVSEYALKEKSIGMDTVARLWVVTKPNDKANIDLICKNILDICYPKSQPGSTFLTPLVDHLFETNPDDLAEGSLNLLMKIFETATTVPEGYHQKFYNFLQRSIYINLERFSYSLIKSLNTWFARLSNDFLSSDEILQILYKITENVSQHISVLPFLNLLEEFSAYKPKADKKFSQQTYIEHLCQEKDLLGLVLQEFRFIKRLLAEKTQGQTITVQLLESLLPIKMKYIFDFVSEMANTVIFLHSLFPGNRTKVDILKELWDITGRNALIPKEKGSILLKIRDIMVSKEGPHMNEDDLKFFLNELNYIQSLTDICYEAYECYTNLFVTLHEKLGNIYDVMFVGSDTDLDCHYRYYRYEKFLRDSYLTREQCFEFKVRVSPEKLEGFDQIWKFMLFSESNQVLERATDFNAMIYSNLENEFRNKGESLWQGFLTTVKKYLTEILENKESVPTELLNKRLSRCLKSIMRMFYRTERSIPREFQPHWKLNNLSLYEAEVIDNSSISLKEDTPILGYLLADWRENLDPRAKVIFTKWFEEFSANGKMSPDQFGMFLQSINRDITVNSSLVKDTFETYDKDRDGLLTLENFFAYYQPICVNHRLEVWNDIATRGEMYGSKFYKFDELGKVKEVIEPKPEITPSLRSQMALDKELFEMLYSLLKLEGGNDLAYCLYWLLKRLPTYPKVFRDIVTLRGVRGVEEPSRRDWTQVFFSKSPETFQYILDIIDYLFTMEDDNTDETRESTSGGLDIWVQNPEFLKYKETWCQDFIKLGGAKYLSDAMQSVKKHPDFNIYSSERMEKTAQRVMAYLCFYAEDPKVKK